LLLKTDTFKLNYDVHIFSKGKGHPTIGWGGPWGSGYVKTLDFPDVRHYKGGRSSAIHSGHLYPRRNPWYSFSEAESTPGHTVPSAGATEKISSDTTRNRSQDHPTSSDPHNFSTRYNSDLHLPTTTLTIFQKGFFHFIIKMYIHLPTASQRASTW